MKKRIILVLKFALVIICVMVVWPFQAIFWPIMCIRWIITGDMEEDIMFFPLPQLANWI